MMKHHITNTDMIPPQNNNTLPENLTAGIIPFPPHATTVLQAMAEQSKQIRINGELATKALNSLRHHAEEVEKNKQAAGSIIYLILAVKKIDERKKDCLIHCQLVHSLNENDPTMEILFVTKGESDPWAAKLRDLGQISTVGWKERNST